MKEPEEWRFGENAPRLPIDLSPTARIMETPKTTAQDAPYRIDETFSRLLKPLENRELSALTESLLIKGCLEPLIVWAEEKILLDGHHRHFICDRNRIPCEIREIEFPNAYAAMAWVADYQIGRRGLETPLANYLLGLVYRRRVRGNARLYPAGHVQPPPPPDATPIPKGPSAFSEFPTGEPAERLAFEAGVSNVTIFEAAKYSKRIDIIGEALGEEVVRNILEGEVKFPAHAIRAIAQSKSKFMREVYDGYRQGFVQETQDKATREELIKPRRVGLLREVKASIAKSWPQMTRAERAELKIWIQHRKD